jgi:ubiquinone/menaquinone biosynthesis C-methylase UbiE
MISTCTSIQNSYRDKRMQPERIMDSIAVKEGMIIGEVGAGEGYFTYHLSRRVGAGGHVFANDIKSSVLEDIRDHCEDNGLTNITTVQGELRDPLFPQKNLDMIVMMLVFHDLEQPIPYFENLKNYLKPGAPVVVIDRDPERWGQGHDHFMSKEEILKKIKTAGYELGHLYMFLDNDNIYVFYPDGYL